MQGRVVAEVAVIPLGTGTAGLSQYVAACLKVLEGREDITYQLTAMGTIIEGTLEKVLEVTAQLHEVPFTKGVSRVVTTLRIDERRDKDHSIDAKLSAVKERTKCIGSGG